MEEAYIVYFLFAKEVHKIQTDSPPELTELLQEFQDVFPLDLPEGLPPVRGIEHQIDFIPGAQIPNKPTYRSNPQEALELQRQVNELLAQGYVRESLSPSAVPTLLVPKKRWDLKDVYRQ